MTLALLLRSTLEAPAVRQGVDSCGLTLLMGRLLVGPPAWVPDGTIGFQRLGDVTLNPLAARLGSGTVTLTPSRLGSRTLRRPW